MKIENNSVVDIMNLHEIDERLYNMNEKRGPLPKIISDLTSKIELIESDNLNLENDKVDIEKRKSIILSNVSEFNEKIEKLNNQTYDVKSNREYEALLSEIDHLKMSLSDENKELETFDARLEEINTTINSNTEDLSSMKENLAKKSELLDETNLLIADKEVELNKDREKLVKTLSKNDYSLYLEKQDEYGGLAFAEVNRKSCSNCFSELPPQIYIDVSKRDILTVCPTCNIFLYSNEEIVD